MDDTTFIEEGKENIIFQSTPKKDNKVVKKSFKNPFKNPFRQVQSKKNITVQLEASCIESVEAPSKKYVGKKTGQECSELREAIKILDNYDKEIKTRELIDKWRSITQAAMSYILNMTLCKIDKIGGYEELRKKEAKQKKKQLEYMMDDSMQDEMETILESDEFQQLPVEDQEEYKQMMEDKLKDFEAYKQQEFKKLEEESNLNTNKELDMEELSTRLKVDYSLVFPVEKE